jgi:adenosylmethionine-8-amino-7-oxononanoate aminotransferase
MEASHVLYRDFSHHYRELVSGRGSWLIDREGREYLDGSAGVAVSNLGHGNRRVARAVASQLARLEFATTVIFTHSPLEKLASTLCSMLPSDLTAVFFCSGGSEAVETAIKLARSYWLLQGRPSKHVVISRWHSYHGATLQALALSGHTGRRRKFLPMMPQSHHIEPSFCYRCPFGKKYPGCNLECAWALEREILRLGPENVAAFLAEPIVGATLGAAVPPKEYFPIIRSICSKHDVLLIADEVMTGMGRTGTMLAIEQWGITPDMVTLAKGLAAGYAPIGAVAVHRNIHRSFATAGAPTDIGFTFSAHPAACAAAQEVLSIYKEEELLSKVRRAAVHLWDHLSVLKSHRIVGDIRGRGLLIGVELVKDKETAEPFDPDLRASRRLLEICLANGLVVYPGSGTADGLRGDHVLIAPPFTISEREIEILVERLASSLDQLADELMPIGRGTSKV